jgi:UDP-glucose 6-dehydrogenase
MANAKGILPPAVEYCQSSYDAADGADAVAIVTEWNEFKLLNLERLRGLMRRPLIFDGRNIYEPERMRRLGVEYCQSSYDAADGADAVAIVTEWNEFKLLNLERLRGLMRRPLVFDGRNIYEPERMRRLGFEYHSIGRRPVFPG